MPGGKGREWRPRAPRSDGCQRQPELGGGSGGALPGKSSLRRVDFVQSEPYFNSFRPPNYSEFWRKFYDFFTLFLLFRLTPLFFRKKICAQNALISVQTSVSSRIEGGTVRCSARPPPFGVSHWRKQCHYLIH